MIIKTLIVEDEIHAVTLIKNLLFLNHKEVKVIGTASTVIGAKELIEQKQPDLLLLDIQLKQGDAFELLDYYGEKIKLGYISNRVHSYSIDPHLWKRFNDEFGFAPSELKN